MGIRSVISEHVPAFLSNSYFVILIETQNNNKRKRTTFERKIFFSPGCLERDLRPEIYSSGTTTLSIYIILARRPRLKITVVVYCLFQTGLQE